MVASTLGRDVSTGQLITLEQDKRLGGMYVIGKTGSGKTTLLINLILQDIEQGMGLCFFDTHGDAITDILARLPSHREQDVILLDLLDNDYAFGLNLFQCNNPQDKQEISRVTSMVMGVFAKLFTESGDLLKEAPNMARTLQHVVPVLLSHSNPQMTMAEIPLLLDNEDARKKLLAPLTNPIVQAFWISYDRWKPEAQQGLVSSTSGRVGNFLTDPLILEIVGQAETTLDFRKIMDSRKILLVKLSRQHELITSLVGSVIVGQIANAAFSRSDTPEHQRVQFNLYADEYQRFSTPTFAELLAEVRKFKIATCVAHQWRSQLDQDNKGATLNAANIVVYQVSGEDADELAGQFDCTPTPSTETRLEPVRAPVSDVIGWLCSGKGAHPKRVVNDFAQAVLVPFTNKLRSGERLPLEFNRDRMQQSYTNLNKMFFEAMDVVSTETALGESMFEELTPHDVTGCLWFNDVSSYDLINVVTDIAKCSDRYKQFQYCFELLTTPHDTSDLDSLERDTIDINFFYYPTFYKLWADTPLDTFEIEQVLQKLYKSELRNIMAGNRRKYGLMEDEEVPELWVFMPAKEQVQHLVDFINEIKAVRRALHDYPIESETGRYVEKPVPRTFADMQKEIANEIANPRKPYSARAKLGTQEYTLSALPFGTPDAPHIVQDRHDRIITQTRSFYCKKRDEVVAEIMARQAELMKPEKKKPRAKQEEDEE